MSTSNINQNYFALKYAQCGNVYEAAIFAGASRAAAAFEGLKLFFTKSVRRKITEAKLEKEECAAEQALRRIAFGRINDAVNLVFADEVTPEMIEQADLYCVSEIKRIKGGGVEIKFFDRQKAAERLIDIENERSGAANAENLISAIYGKGDCP